MTVRYNKRMKRGVVWALVATLLGVGSMSVHGTTFTSPNFSINGSIGDSSAGAQTSTNYQMVSAAGESIAGESASGSYKLAQGYVATLENSLQLAVQPNGLIGHYSFDQNVGTSVLDDSGNANAASFVGTPTWTTGKLGSALTGFSTSNYLDADYDTTYNVANLTVCSWLNLTNPSTNPMAVARSKGAPDADGMWSLGFNAGSTPRARIYFNGSNHVLNGSTALGTGSWNHVCFTYDGGDFVLYVNGSENDRLTLNQPLGSLTQPLRIGVISNGSQPFDGIVDEVKLFGRALAGHEVKAEYDASSAGLPTGLAFADGVTPGQSQTASYDTIIQTSAAGYGLAISQNANLTNGGNSIAAVSGSIGSPVSWSEGSTKGLGFTLYGTNATAIPGVWSGGSSYAALPASATTFYNRTGLNGGAKDTVNLRLRLDVPSSQPNGTYSNQMVITGTMTP